MVIEKLEEKDFCAARELMSGVHALHADARPDIYDAQGDPLCREDYLMDIGGASSVMLKAVVAGRTAGIIAAQVRDAPQNPVLQRRKVLVIDAVAVDAEFRRLGVGSALMEAAEARGRELGAEASQLMVWEFNRDARRFYSSLGMTVRSEILEKKLK